MPRYLVYALPFALFVLVPTVSWAASDDCPDGWFCDPNAAPPPAAPIEPPAPAPASPPPAQPGASPSRGVAPGYAPPMLITVPPEPPPPKRRRRRFHEWGFNLHLEGALLDNHSDHVKNTAMGGLGFGFRFRPLPPLAFEAGIDLLKDNEQHGYSRTEAALLLNTLLFFNPHDVVQIYALAGLAFSGADVSITPHRGEAPFKRYDEHYSYFGGQLGLGLEVRVSRRFAIGGDVLGFVRGRSEQRSHEIPEYIDNETERISRTSGGGLLRAGVTFYW